MKNLETLVDQWIGEENKVPSEGNTYLDGYFDGIFVVDDRQIYNKDMFPHYSAYTVAELGEILSSYRQGIMPSWNANFDHGWYFKGHGYTIHENTEADARAKMLIYLLENNLINIKE